MLKKSDKTAICEEEFSLKRGACLGKYRLMKRIGKGGFCEVWQARDQVEGITVALKIPLADVHGKRDNYNLLREIRAVSGLRHPNILPVKNADFISDHAVLATEQSDKTLADCSKPMSYKRIIRIVLQVLEGLAYAHRHKIVHCDVNPNNIFLFPDGVAKLGDFGISIKVKGRSKTIEDFGTPGYVAPEQAYGYPKYSSDTFALGLILYEYITGNLPRWPFTWPYRGSDRLNEKTGRPFADFIKRATSVDPKLRFRDGASMLEAMKESLPAKLKKSHSSYRVIKPADWRKTRRDVFSNKYRKVFPVMTKCADCNEPISEAMQICPWCGSGKNRFDTNTILNYVCPDCHKGVLAEWRFCPWCYGKGFEAGEPEKSVKVTYHSKCVHCDGKLMRFMKYCPWCRHKVKQNWHVRPFPEVCGHCDKPVDSEFWSYCPWCKESLIK